MKLLVDEMPYFTSDCPFYDSAAGVCRIDNSHCVYFDDPCGERESGKCCYLKAITEIKKD